MSSRETMASSRNRLRRSVLQPILQNDATPFQDDIMVEILWRLPVKSLLRFKCVSKPWNSLISSSEFVNYHLHRSTTDPTLRYLQFLGQDRYDDNVYRFSRSLQFLIDNNLSPSPPPPSPSSSSSSSSPSSSPPSPSIFSYLSFKISHKGNVWIVGSCNGLICWVDDHDDMYVSYLNPSTRLKSRSPCIRKPWTTLPMFGFGYDPLSDSYKTVAIWSGLDKSTIVKVYALGGPSSWRKIRSFPFILKNNEYYNSGKFVSGTLNWLGYRPNGDGSIYIVSVDIGKETCGKFFLPHFKGVTEPNLCVFGGCLCFFYIINRTNFVLWQMKLHGVTESWIALLNIYLPDVGIDTRFNPIFRVLFMLDKGEVLIETAIDDVVILYNPRYKSWKYIDFRSDRTELEGTTHVESLVSPCPVRYNLRFRVCTDSG